MKKIYKYLVLSLTLLCCSCTLDFSSVINNKSGGSSVDASNIPTTTISADNDVSSNEDDLSTLYSTCVKSVVTVFNYVSYTNRGQKVTTLYSTGSGFVYSVKEDYIYIYTNAHVTSVSSGYTNAYYEVAFYDGVRDYATLVKSDGSEDVAILKVAYDNQDVAIATIGNSDTLKAGETVVAIGSPLGYDYANTMTHGIVSNVKVMMDTDNDEDNDETTMYLIQVDASLNPGNSGGPLFNSKGEVVGVNTIKIVTDSSGNTVESFNFSIPINHFVRVANALATKGSYSRPLIGVTVMDITKLSLSDRSTYSITVDKGLYVESVSSTGASNGIISSNSVITKINGVNVNNMADFACELYKYSAGEVIEVTTTSVSGSNETNHSITLK